MERFRVEQVGPDRVPVVFDLVQALLVELGEEGDETGPLDRRELLQRWGEDPGRHLALIAWTEDGTAAGVVTVAEAFAFYARGWYGIVNEMYVVPEHRGAGVGKLLLDAVKDLARESRWVRVDVTAPESPRWERTRRFYERAGFTFTGPKLKYLVR